MCAIQWRQELDLKTMLNRLEDNQKLIESVDIELPAKSKAGAVNSTKKKKQSHANPATQQQPRCSACGLEHDVKQCPRENHRLNQEDEQRGKLFPGSDKSKRRDSLARQQNEEDRTGENKTRGCYICFALGSPRWNNHSDRFCWSKKRFAKIKHDLEAYFLEQIELMQQEPVDKRSEQTSHQSQNPTRSRTDFQGQANQGAATQSQQMSAQKQFLQGPTEHSQSQQKVQICIRKCIDYIGIHMLITTQCSHHQWVSLLIHGSCRECSNRCKVDQVLITPDNLYNLQTHKGCTDKRLCRRYKAVLEIVHR
jgi:hypothetical protein